MKPAPAGFASDRDANQSTPVSFDLVTVLVIMTISLVTPGPDMMLVLKNSIGGRARGLSTVAGIAVGLGVQTTGLSIGFTLMAAHAASITEVLRWGGAGVLIYFGARALLAKPAAITGDTAEAPRGLARDAFLEGLLCNLTNPKAFMFFTGLISQLIYPGSPPWLPWVLPVLLTVHGAICWAVISLLMQAGGIASRLQRAQGFLSRLFGTVLIAFGLGLVFWRP